MKKHNPTSIAYTELQEAFDYFNRELFNNEIPHCLITFQREKRTYGYFSQERFIHRSDKVFTDEIAMNPAYFATIPLLEVFQTLVHEMVHAWQFHYGKPGRRGYHNKEWGKKMESIGLMPSSTGKPGGSKTGERMADYPIENGIFLKKATELINSGYGISWLDRYPIRIPSNSLLELNNNTIDQNLKETFIAINNDFSDLFIEQKINKSNRIKYRCDQCGGQVWGKPGLNLICGEKECNHSCYTAV